MIVDHIGVVVKSIEDGLTFWNGTFGYSQKTRVIVNSRQKVKVVFLTKKNSVDIKLIEPTGKDSSVYRFSIKGGGLHHICFKCDDVTRKVGELRGHGVRLVAEPQSGEAFNDNLIAFMMDKYALSFELIDTDERAGMLA